MSTPLAMPDGEIAVRYRQAKEQQKQIKILAELCDTSKAAIIEALVREGIEVKKPRSTCKRGAVKRVDYEKIQSLYDQGLGDKDIAELMEISWRTVRKWRSDNSLLMNNGRSKP